MVAPMVHLHYGADRTDDAASHCVACNAYHAVAIPADDLNAPEQSVALAITAVERGYVAVVTSTPPRAPPQLLG